MKTQTRGTFVALSLALIFSLSVAVAHAQTREKIKATIPFDFGVGNQQLPAGQYTFDSQTMPPALLIRDAKYYARAAVLPIAAESPKACERTKLVFHRYGNHYFLSQLWSGGQNRGHQLVPGSMEREIAKSLPPESTTVVAGLK